MEPFAVPNARPNRWLIKWSANELKMNKKIIDWPELKSIGLILRTLHFILENQLISDPTWWDYQTLLAEFVRRNWRKMRKELNAKIVR